MHILHVQIARTYAIFRNYYDNTIIVGYAPNCPHVVTNLIPHHKFPRYYNKTHIFPNIFAYNSPKELSVEKSHSLCFANDTLTINGVVQVVEVDEKEAHFKLEECTLVIKGAGLNIAKLDKGQGGVILEVKSIANIVYKQTSTLKGLFR